MQTRVDLRFVSEAERYAFRFTCEACAHFDAVRLSCGEGFPNDAHRSVDLGRAASLEFCKSFELG
jgi:hypothetical protein